MLARVLAVKAVSPYTPALQRQYPNKNLVITHKIKVRIQIMQINDSVQWLYCVSSTTSASTVRS